MARAPIEIGIASETKAFKQGMEAGVIKPTEDAIDALDALGKSRGPEQLDRELGQAQKATKNLDKEIERTADDIEKEFRNSYRSAGKSADDFHDRAGGNLTEFKSEAVQNFSEVTSSFSGEMSSIQDLAQGTLGGLASSVAGPVGIAAGAAAVGVGLVGAALEQVQEEQEKASERAAEWADVFIDSGGRIVSAANVVASVLAISTDPERYKEATQNAKDWGVDVGTAMRALAGDATALSVVESSLSVRTEEANRLLAEQETQVDQNAGAAYDLADAVDRGQKAFKTLNDDMSAGSAIAESVSSALIGLARDAGTATKEVDEVGNAVYSLPDGTEIFVDAQTGVATQNLDRFKGDLDGVPETVTTAIEFAAPDVDSTVRAIQTQFSRKIIDLKIRATDPSGRIY